MPESQDSSPDRKYYYNLATGEVEYGLVSDWTHRMGPYDTADDAARALEIVQERNKAWEDEDRRERAWEEGEADED